jgi:hypothetical protein
MASDHQTTLYDTDILTWSERQVELLRRIAKGAATNETPDWANIIEEIDAVGRNEVRACRSLLLQALLHMLKAEAWPLSTAVPHWQSEALVARTGAADAYAPSMREKINLAKIYAQALRALPETIDGVPPLPVDPVCRVTLDEMLDV